MCHHDHEALPRRSIWWSLGIWVRPLAKDIAEVSGGWGLPTIHLLFIQWSFVLFILCTQSGNDELDKLAILWESLVTRNGVFLVATEWQSFIEMIYEFVVGLVDSQIGEKGRKSFPLISTILHQYIMYKRLACRNVGRDFRQTSSAMSWSLLNLITKTENDWPQSDFSLQASTLLLSPGLEDFNVCAVAKSWKQRSQDCRQSAQSISVQPAHLQKKRR